MGISSEKIIGILSEYVDKNPSDLEFYSLLGTMLRESGLAMKAGKIHRNILAKPSLKKKFRAKITAELAKDMYSLGNLEQAERLVNDVLKIDSKNRDAYIVKFDILKSKGAIEEAIRIAEKYSDCDSKTLSSLYTDYSKKLLADGDISKARKISKKAIQICKDNIDAHIVQGDIEIKAKKFKDAIDHYFRAIDVNANYTTPIIKKIENAFYLGHAYDDFSTRLREELVDKNDNSDLHCELGKFLKKRMMTDEAKDEFKKALEFNPTHLKARKELIETLIDEKRVDALKEEFEELFSEIKQNMSFFCTKCSNRDRYPHWRCPVCSSYDSYEKMVFLF